jgi:hypothetical protein
VHKTADAGGHRRDAAPAQKGLLSLADGGYLTGLGRDAAEHAQGPADDSYPGSRPTAPPKRPRLRRPRAATLPPSSRIGGTIRGRRAAACPVPPPCSALRRNWRKCWMSAAGFARHVAEGRLVFHQPRAQLLQMVLASIGRRGKALELVHRLAQGSPGSTSRMILPMYCIWRRRASCLVMRWASRMASRKRSGMSIFASRSRESRPVPRRVPARRSCRA